MSQPPRAVEALLKSLGADPYLSDVVLGDLSEEFAERAAFDGEPEARRWYTREALRSVPHLLRNASRQLRVGDLPRLIGVALFAWLALLPITLPLYLLLWAAGQAMGFDWPSLPPRPGNTTFITIAALAMPLAGSVGGYIAAWRNARAPLVGSAAFAGVLTSINLVAGLFWPSPLPTTYRVAALAMFNIAAIVGGVVRVIRLKPSARSELSIS